MRGTRASTVKKTHNNSASALHFGASITTSITDDVAVWENILLYAEWGKKVQSCPLYLSSHPLGSLPKPGDARLRVPLHSQALMPFSSAGETRRRDSTLLS